MFFLSFERFNISRSAGFLGKIKAALWRGYWLSNMRQGQLVGTDKFGNQYFQADPHKSVFGMVNNASRRLSVLQPVIDGFLQQILKSSMLLMFLASGICGCIA